MRITILLLFALPLPSRADVVFTKPLADLGEIKGGARLQHKFEFEVRGTQAATLVGFERSCGCLAPSWSRTTYQPGEKGTLVLDIRSLGQPDGPHAWNARLVYRQGDETKHAVLTVRAKLKHEIVVEPPRLAVYVEKILPQEIRVHDRRGGKPLEILQVECTIPGLKFEPRKEAGGVSKVLMIARADRLPAERQDGVIRIFTSDADYAQIDIPLSLMKGVSAMVRPHPEIARLPVGAGRETATALVRLRHRDDQPVKIASLEPTHPAFTCTWAAGPGNDATVRISVRAAALPPGTSAAALHVLLEGGDRVLVPIAVQPE